MTPQQHLERISSRYHGAWATIDRMRFDRGKKLRDWPAWCYLPMIAAHAIVLRGQPLRSQEQVVDVSALSAMAPWRLTKGVYRFDPDLYAALVGTDLRGPIPCDVLFRLPEWCLYMETPDLRFMDEQLDGVWAHLEWDAESNRGELRILLHVGERLIPIPVLLGAWSIAEAVEKMFCAAEAALAGRTLRETDPVSMANAITPIVSMLLYLCADEPEIEDRAFPGVRPGRPVSKKIKGMLRFFEAGKIRVWDVGTQTGERLRQAQERARADTSTGDQHQQERESPIPHVRRAHWHGFWSGPLAGDRRFSVKWLPPILVSVQS